MRTLRSAHVDTFCRDNLPPAGAWPELIFTLPELQYPAQLNCGEALLDRAVERFGPERPCLRTDDAQSWTYGEVLAWANRIAATLVDLGVVPGNRVLLRGPNNPWLVASWFAVMKAGAVAVTTMPLLRAAELSAIVQKARPTIALCDHRYLDELAAIAPAGLQVVAFGSDSHDDLAVRAATKDGEFANVATAADDTCLIAFTSGTTGQPKGCMHFHRDVLAIADTFSAHVLRPQPDDLFTGSPPLAFTFGLGGLVVFPMHCGAETLLLEGAAPDSLAAAVARHRATVCFTAPTAYRAMLAIEEVDLSSLRRAVSAGEPLPQATWDAFHRRTGVKLIDGIGATELLHVFISAADDDIRPGATGKAVPGYEAAVVDSEGDPIPDGTTGQLAVRGPTGCRYLADERQSQYVRNGLNMTGDFYLRDADGYFWFQSRADDMIISSGYNIAGPEVEAALLAHDSVLEAAVVGAADDQRGAIVKAFVVLRGDCAATPETARALQNHVKTTIAPYKYPRSVVFVDTLPRTATGKLQRYKLRDDR